MDATATELEMAREALRKLIERVSPSGIPVLSVMTSEDHAFVAEECRKAGIEHRGPRNKT